MPAEEASLKQAEKIPQLREPYWNGDGVNIQGMIMKTTTRIAINCNRESKAGGVYWNNNGGGGVVINRCRQLSISGPNGACARCYYDQTSSHSTPSALAGFSIERNSSDQPG